MAKLPLSVQLYTVRDLTAVDFAGTLKKVADIGYRNVEPAGWGNLKTAADVRKALDDAGLKAPSAHVGIHEFNAGVQKVIDDAKTIGYDNIVVPYIDESYRSAAGYKKLASELNTFGKQVKAAGLQLYYHNHAFEFDKFNGQMGFDILWENTDADLVKCELDVYWIQRGGVDPVSYIKKLGQRVQLVHLKDMDKTDPGKFAPVGRGTLNFPAIVAAAAEAGVKYGAVEQDNCYGMDPLESITVSYNNLKQMELIA
jgi:sugar phosphate isomerase/epimerase